MISGIKISQLPVLENLEETDYFVVRRGITTAQASQFTLLDSITALNVGTGEDIVYSSGAGLIQLKRLSAVGGFLTLQTINDQTLILSSNIPESGITDTMILEISSIGKVLPDAINTTNSLSGYVLFSEGPGVPPIWKEVPMDATVNNVANKVVARDLSGNFYATTVVADLCGNADTSTKWLSSRTITLSGIVYGNTTIDGSQDVTIFTTVSTESITDIHISPNAGILDTKLNTITTPQKVSPNAIDYTGAQPGDVLTSTGSATTWQHASALEVFIPDGSITTAKLNFQVITENEIADNAVTTPKLSAASVTTTKIANDAITTQKILDGSVTLAKTTATPAALSGTLVSRDSAGNLSATEITANLKGNSTTSTRWSSPMTLLLGGDVNGLVSFNGSQTAVLSTVLDVPVPNWVIFDAYQRQNLSGTFIQNDGSTGEGEQVTVYQTVTGIRTTIFTGSFIQDGTEDIFIIIPYENQPFTLTDENVSTFLANNLQIGTDIYASGESIFDGVYTILDRENDVLSNTITLLISTDNIQVIGETPLTITFDETFYYPPHSYIVGSIVTPRFLSGVSLNANPYTPQTTGLYIVTDVIDDYTFTFNTNITQYASGDIILQRCDVDSNYGIPVVGYVDVGHYVLNFDVPFENPFYYGFTGSAISLEATPTMNSVENVIGDYRDTLNLQVRALRNNGTVSPYDFKRVQVMCFGYKIS